MKVLKDSKNILTLDADRDIEYEQDILVNTLSFPEESMLATKCYGKLGFTNNFFVDALVDMDIQQSGYYQFRVMSDDGFRIEIDNKTVCEHTTTQAFHHVKECQVELIQGLHHFKFQYFQASGPLGLSVQYQFKDSIFYDIGIDSEHTIFKEVQ